MKFRLILFTIFGAIAISSCSTAYRTGQTPDDVYFSPERETGAYVNVQQKRDGRYMQDDYYGSYDDNWIRMSVRNRLRWNVFNDYAYNDWYFNRWDTWNYNYNYSNPWAYNYYWNSYYRWNSYYNPYCRQIIVVNPKTNPQGYARVRNFNLNSYTNTTYSNTNQSRYNSRGIRLSPPAYNNTNKSNSNSSLGSSLRNIFSGNSNNSNGSYNPSNSSTRPVRAYEPANSGNSSSGSRSSGSSSGSSGSSKPSRPSRGGGN